MISLLTSIFLVDFLQEGQPDDFFEKDFMNAMKGLGLEDPGSTPESFISMMQGMMTNLLSKDILYPSLKEIEGRVSISSVCCPLVPSEDLRYMILRQRKFFNYIFVFTYDCFDFCPRSCFQFCLPLRVQLFQ